MKTVESSERGREGTSALEQLLSIPRVYKEINGLYRFAAHLQPAQEPHP
jgi:hypothetical protein